MSPILPQPVRHPKTGVYYLRKVIPAHLRVAFGGRSEVRKSLGTKDWRQAKLLHAVAIAETEKLLAEAVGCDKVGLPDGGIPAFPRGSGV